MISHDLFAAPAYLDRMIILSGGQVAAEGTPEELKEKKSVRRFFGIPEGIQGDFF